MGLLAALSLILSAMGVTPVLADDEAMPPIATEEPTLPPTEEPVLEETVPVVGALDQLPAGTSLVVLDQSGETLPLATEEAAEVLATPDPYFRVGGTVYEFTAADCDPDPLVDDPCSNPIQAAIDYLAGLDATPDDNTIYVEAGTYTENVVIDGSQWTTAPLGNLILLGDGSGSTTVDGTLLAHNLTNAFGLEGFTFHDSVYIVTDGNVKVSDVIVNGTSASGFDVNAGGSVIVETVMASGNTSNGALVTATDDISVSASDFSANTVSGLDARAGGSITLDGVTASSNGGHGAYIAASGILMVADSSFDHNSLIGLYARSLTGSVLLDGVSTSGNGRHGSEIYAQDSIYVSNSTFNNSTGGWGFGAQGYEVILDGVTANGNQSYGAGFFSTAPAQVFCSTFSSNGWGVVGITPDLYLNGVNSHGNSSGDYENWDPAGNIWLNDFDCNPVLQVETNVFEYQSALYLIYPQTQDELPSQLGTGDTFASALKVVLTHPGDTAYIRAISLSFPIPENMKGTKLAVMFWNGSAWIEVPGGQVHGDFFVITVGQPGVYVLVGK